MGIELPMSGPGVIRERGFNLDYLLAGATGWIMLDRHGLTEQDRLACRAVGRRIWLPIEDQNRAMLFAMAYWGLLRTVFLILSFATLITVGIIDHTLLGGPIRFLLAVFLGVGFMAMVAQVIAAYRFRGPSIVDVMLPAFETSWIDRHGRQRFARLRAPRPYDSLLSIGTGLFAGVSLLGAT